ncbi:MFS transporter [Pelomonas sp. CA6]|uniref:MFS transporter n=1 Tax=Pelomonas sp. CA6 TaxID=2907999 RepID=UPI001F4C4382|nr:MFS transporter [Pelomonas sp. CA6]MCH7343150.1 MFS transporter [Pelomonas sp. CA6]
MSAGERVAAAAALAGAEPAESAVLGRWPRLAVLLAILLCSYAIALEATVVSAAIPTVIQGFGGLSDLSWVFSAYLIAQAVTMPLFGGASDRLGRKRCYAVAAALFFAGTLACGLAWDLASLVLFRVLQGVGAGGLITVGTAALNDIITQHQRGRYQALINAVWGLAAVSGPVVGALVMQWLDWRYIFWINLPIVLVSTALLMLYHRGRPAAGGQGGEPEGGLALMPSLYLCAALLSAMVMLVHGQTLTRAQWMASAALLGVGALLLWQSQRTGTAPLFPAGLLRLPIVPLAAGSAFLCGAVAMGATVYVPSFAALMLRADTLAIGSTVGLMTLSWTCSGIAVGLLLQPGQLRRAAIVASALVLGGLLLLAAAAGQAGGMAVVLLACGLLGLGLGGCSVVFSVALQSLVGDAVRGSATSTFYLARMLGQAIGVALCGGVLAGSDAQARQLLRQQTDPAALAAELARGLGDGAALAASLRGGFVLLFALLAALGLAHLWLALRTPRAALPVSSPTT